MANSKTLIPVPLKRNPITAKDKLYNEIVAILSGYDVKFSKTSLDSLGTSLCFNLCQLLWHVTCHHEYFIARNALLPEIFQQFHNLDDFKSKKLKKTQLSSAKLEQYINSISSIISQPLFSKHEYVLFRNVIVHLTDCTKSVLDHMRTNIASSSNNRVQTEPIRNTEDFSQVKLLDSTVNVLDKIQNTNEYEPIPLIDFEPSERYIRRHWIDNLRISSKIALFRMPYGGNIGTINFIWKIGPEIDQTLHGRTIQLVSKDLLVFHTRQMHKDFIEKYASAIKGSKSAMRVMYRELTGDTSAATNAAQEQKQIQISRFLANCDEPELLLDMHALNGNPQSTIFDDFWDEVSVLFDEYQTAVQKRRHGVTSYLPFAISIRELVERVVKQKPNIRVPSIEWVRLQFSPKNPYCKTALKHGRFDIKYMVQSGVNSDKEDLLMYTDGSADHNVSHLSVQISLICLMITLDLDMIVAMRCCPTQSWVNPAERVMSLLNITLQNCALERAPMDDNFENIMKPINSMNQLHNLSSRLDGLRASFVDKSMMPVKQLVNERFESMSLKSQHFE